MKCDDAFLKVGYLFKRNELDYDNKHYMVYEFIDYVIAIVYGKYDDILYFNVASGDSKGVTGTVIGYYEDELNSRIGKFTYGILTRDIYKELKFSDNIPDFDKIREYKMSHTSKYYILNEKNSHLTDLYETHLYSKIKKDEKKLVKK